MRENLGYKILALAIAFLLWTKVTSDRNPNVTKAIVNVPVVYEGLQEELVATDAPEATTVNVMGPQSALRSLNAKRVTAHVDLSGLDLGSHSVKAAVTLPPETSNKVTVLPVDLRIEIEDLRRKTLKVEVSGAPPIGYTVSQASASPAEAVVKGRSGLVDQVQHLVAIVSDEAAEPPAKERQYPVVALNSKREEIKGLKIEPDRVDVTLPEAPAAKCVFVSPTVAGQPSYPYKVLGVSVSPESVTIYGRPNILARVSTISTDQIDITNATATVEKTVGLQTPSGVISGEARTVRVTVEIGQ